MAQDIVDEFKLTWLPKKTFEILVNIPYAEIEKVRDDVVREAGINMEIKGFRKGKAPKKQILENINEEKLFNSILSKILPDYYQKSLLKFGLRPIINPKVSIVSTKENENWQIKISSCETPDIKLGNFKEDLRKEFTTAKIWKPGDEGKQEKIEEKKEEKFQKIIEILLKCITVEPSDLLIDDEVNHKLSGLLDQTQKLGISIDQYLSSTGKTIEQIKEEYRSQSLKNISVELILQKISEEEKIEVNPEEIDKAISEAKNEEEKNKLESQKYLLASILRQQKTIDFLINLV